MATDNPVSTPCGNGNKLLPKKRFWTSQNKPEVTYLPNFVGTKLAPLFARSFAVVLSTHCEHFICTVMTPPQTTQIFNNKDQSPYCILLCIP